MGGWYSSTTFTGFPDAPLYVAHNGACGFSFNDGHSEMHKWLTSTLNLQKYLRSNQGVSRRKGVAENSLPTSNPDWVWFVQHTACKFSIGTMPLLEELRFSNFLNRFCL